MLRFCTETSLTRWPADEDVAVGRDFQPGDHAQNGGLAAAARPEQPEQLTLLDGKADVMNGRDIAKPFADIL